MHLHNFLNERSGLPFLSRSPHGQRDDDQATLRGRGSEYAPSIASERRRSTSNPFSALGARLGRALSSTSSATMAEESGDL